MVIILLLLWVKQILQHKGDPYTLQNSPLQQVQKDFKNYFSLQSTELSLGQIFKYGGII